MIPQQGPLPLHAMNEDQRTTRNIAHGMGSRVMCNKQHLTTRINLEYIIRKDCYFYGMVWCVSNNINLFELSYIWRQNNI